MPIRHVWSKGCFTVFTEISFRRKQLFLRNTANLSGNLQYASLWDRSATAPLPIRYRSSTNPLPIRYHPTTDPLSIRDRSATDPLPFGLATEGDTLKLQEEGKSSLTFQCRQRHTFRSWRKGSRDTKLLASPWRIINELEIGGWRHALGPPRRGRPSAERGPSASPRPTLTSNDRVWWSPAFISIRFDCYLFESEISNDISRSHLPEDVEGNPDTDKRYHRS